MGGGGGDGPAHRHGVAGDVHLLDGPLAGAELHRLAWEQALGVGKAEGGGGLLVGVRYPPLHQVDRGPSRKAVPGYRGGEGLQGQGVPLLADDPVGFPGDLHVAAHGDEGGVLDLHVEGVPAVHGTEQAGHAGREGGHGQEAGVVVEVVADDLHVVPSLDPGPRGEGGGDGRGEAAADAEGLSHRGSAPVVLGGGRHVQGVAGGAHLVGHRDGGSCHCGAVLLRVRARAGVGGQLGEGVQGAFRQGEGSVGPHLACGSAQAAEDEL